MAKSKEQLILTQEDYDVIMANLKSTHSQLTFTKENAEELEAELKKAKIVSKEKFPADVVKLNSQVVIKEEKSNKTMEFTIVTPERSDIKQKRISLMSPIGTALIGYRQGSTVAWNVPAGQKIFSILEVRNE